MDAAHAAATSLETTAAFRVGRSRGREGRRAECHNGSQGQHCIPDFAEHLTLLIVCV
jgi:hypothetical protein